MKSFKLETNKISFGKYNVKKERALMFPSIVDCKRKINLNCSNENKK